MGSHEGASRLPPSVHPGLHSCDGLDVKVDVEVALVPDLLEHLGVEDVYLGVGGFLVAGDAHHSLLDLDEEGDLLEVLELTGELHVLGLDEFYPEVIDVVHAAPGCPQTLLVRGRVQGSGDQGLGHIGVGCDMLADRVLVLVGPGAHLEDRFDLCLSRFDLLLRCEAMRRLPVLPVDRFSFLCGDPILVLRDLLLPFIHHCDLISVLRVLTPHPNPIIPLLLPYQLLHIKILYQPCLLLHHILLVQFPFRGELLHCHNHIQDPAEHPHTYLVPELSLTVVPQLLVVEELSRGDLHPAYLFQDLRDEDLDALGLGEHAVPDEGCLRLEDGGFGVLDHGLEVRGLDDVGEALELVLEVGDDLVDVAPL